jgi:succinate dehydrogenase/fumarate reductase flavoprotein subunit
VLDALGIRSPPKAADYEVVIVGGGPAGLAAAVYAASDGLSVAVVALVHPYLAGSRQSSGGGAMRPSAG